MDISKDREPNQKTLLILCIYFLGLPLIEILQEQYKDLSTEAMSVYGKWIQKYKPRKISSKRKKINEFIIDETQLKVGSRYIWLWVAIEPKHRQIFRI